MIGDVLQSGRAIFPDRHELCCQALCCVLAQPFQALLERSLHSSCHALTGQPGHLLRKNQELRRQRDRLMKACERMAKDWRHRLNTMAMGIGMRAGVRQLLAELRNLIADHGGDEKAGGFGGSDG